MQRPAFLASSDEFRVEREGFSRRREEDSLFEGIYHDQRKLMP